MGSWATMELHFAKEKHARWAVHIIRNLAALSYAPCDGLDLDVDAAGLPLSELCLAQEELLSAYDLEEHYCDTALSRLERTGTHIFIDGVQDLQWTFGMGAPLGYTEFFPQLCFALAMRFPQVHFTAGYRYEMTVSGAIQRVRALWDGRLLRFRELWGERPFNEEAWDTWVVYDWILRDGTFERVKDAQSPLQEHYFALLEEARAVAEAGDPYAAFRYVDQALALPGCPEAPAVEVRAVVGRSLRRRGVRRFVKVGGPVPEELLAQCKRSLTELPMDVGTHVLRDSGGCVQDVDTTDGSVHAEIRLWDSESSAYLIGSCHLVDIPSQARVYSHYLIDWDYER